MSIYITPSKNDFQMIRSLPLSKNQSCQSVQVCIVRSALLPSSLTGPSKDRHFDLRSQFVCVSELQHCSSLALQMYPPLSCSREISTPSPPSFQFLWSASLSVGICWSLWSKPHFPPSTACTTNCCCLINTYHLLIFPVVDLIYYYILLSHCFLVCILTYPKSEGESEYSIDIY